MRGLPFFLAVSLGAHISVLMLGGAAGRVVDHLPALSATIRLPAEQIQEPVLLPDPQNRPRLAVHPVRRVTKLAAGKSEQPASESVAVGQPAAAAQTQESKPVDPVVLGFWEDDIEQRIKQAGQRFFTGQPGRARVAMVLSGAGELLELSVTGDAGGMAEKAIRSVQRWPRFEGEPRSFKRVLAFVLAT